MTSSARRAVDRPLPGMSDWMLRADRVGEPLVWNLNTNPGPVMVHRVSCGQVPAVQIGTWDTLPLDFERLGLLDLMIRDAYAKAKAGHPHPTFCHHCLMERQ